MRRIIILIFLFVVCSVAHTLAQDIEGIWFGTNDKSSKAVSLVRIYIEEGKLYGNIVKLLDEKEAEDNPLCTKCTGELKNQPISKIRIIHGLDNKNGIWYGKKGILDPYKGKFHNVKIWVENGELKVRGYKGIFFRTLTWKRAN